MSGLLRGSKLILGAKLCGRRNYETVSKYDPKSVYETNFDLYYLNDRTTLYKPVTQLAYLCKAIVLKGVPEQISMLKLPEYYYTKEAQDSFHQMFNQQRINNCYGMWTKNSLITKSTMMSLLAHSTALCNFNKSAGDDNNNNNNNKINLKGQPMFHKHLLNGITFRSFEGSMFQLEGQIPMVLFGDKPLQPYAGPDDIVNSINVPVKWDEVINPTFHMNLENRPMYNRAMPIAQMKMFPNLIFVNGTSIKPTLSSMLTNGFSVALSTAAALNNISWVQMMEGQVPEVLQMPYTLKCVAYQGRAFAFAVIQINTLDLTQKSGVKNFVWFSPPEVISSFIPSYTLQKGNYQYRFKKRFLKYQTASLIKLDFTYQPIINFFKFMSG